jgi:hypothetical protein
VLVGGVEEFLRNVHQMHGAALTGEEFSVPPAADAHIGHYRPFGNPSSETTGRDRKLDRAMAIWPNRFEAGKSVVVLTDTLHEFTQLPHGIPPERYFAWCGSFASALALVPAHGSLPDRTKPQVK